MKTQETIELLKEFMLFKIVENNLPNLNLKDVSLYEINRIKSFVINIRKWDDQQLKKCFKALTDDIKFLKEAAPFIEYMVRHGEEKIGK